MTEQIKNAIEYLKDVLEEVKATYGSYRDGKFSEVKLAIRSLQAWDEVLQELDRQKALSEIKNYTGLLESTIYDNCINIINQHLAEVSEC